MSAGTGGSEADPASCWVGLSLHEFAGLTSSLDAEQTVAVLALCDCSPESHEPGSDRVVPGKVLLSAEPGLGPNLRSNGGSPGTGCTTLECTMELCQCPKKVSWGIVICPCRLISTCSFKAVTCP